MNMEHETFECSFKKAFEKDDGKVTIYITKDDGTDMTIYGEAIGSQRWPTGARLKINAQPVKTSKNGKQYQTASSVELLEGGVAIPNDVPSVTPNAAPKQDSNAQWKEKYRLTMSNLCASALQSGKEVNFETIDSIVRKILNAKMDSVEDLPADAPF